MFAGILHFRVIRGNKDLTPEQVKEIEKAIKDQADRNGGKKK